MSHASSAILAAPATLRSVMLTRRVLVGYFLTSLLAFPVGARAAAFCSISGRSSRRTLAGPRCPRAQPRCIRRRIHGALRNSVDRPRRCRARASPPRCPTSSSRANPVSGAWVSNILASLHRRHKATRTTTATSAPQIFLSLSRLARRPSSSWNHPGVRCADCEASLRRFLQS